MYARLIEVWKTEVCQSSGMELEVLCLSKWFNCAFKRGATKVAEKRKRIVDTTAEELLGGGWSL